MLFLVWDDIELKLSPTEAAQMLTQDRQGFRLVTNLLKEECAAFPVRGARRTKTGQLGCCPNRDFVKRFVEGVQLEELTTYTYAMVMVALCVPAIDDLQSC